MINPDFNVNEIAEQINSLYTRILSAKDELQNIQSNIPNNFLNSIINIQQQIEKIAKKTIFIKREPVMYKILNDNTQDEIRKRQDYLTKHIKNRISKYNQDEYDKYSSKIQFDTVLNVSQNHFKRIKRPLTAEIIKQIGLSFETYDQRLDDIEKQLSSVSSKNETTIPNPLIKSLIKVIQFQSNQINELCNLCSSSYKNNILKCQKLSKEQNISSDKSIVIKNSKNEQSYSRKRMMTMKRLEDIKNQWEETKFNIKLKINHISTQYKGIDNQLNSFQNTLHSITEHKNNTKLLLDRIVSNTKDMDLNIRKGNKKLISIDNSIDLKKLQDSLIQAQQIFKESNNSIQCRIRQLQSELDNYITSHP